MAQKDSPSLMGCVTIANHFILASVSFMLRAAAFYAHKTSLSRVCLEYGNPFDHQQRMDSFGRCSSRYHQPLLSSSFVHIKMIQMFGAPSVPCESQINRALSTRLSYVQQVHQVSFIICVCDSISSTITFWICVCFQFKSLVKSLGQVRTTQQRKPHFDAGNINNEVEKVQQPISMFPNPSVQLELSFSLIICVF